MLALVRGDFPVFLHVFGAMVLVGAVAAAAIAAAGGGALRRRVAFRTLLLLVLPAWALMRIAGQWVQSREDWPDDLTWLGIGFLVGDVGLVVLLVAVLVAWWSVRAPERRWPARTAAVLTSLYLLALFVAMWAMTTRPD